MKNNKRKLFTVMLICISMISAMMLPSCAKDPTETTELPHNPLTGELEADGYDTASADRRVAAFVVENAPDARPQWGLDDAKYSPDIVIQGEVEGGITRTLWMYADYEKLPEIIGPMRSARPPFIKFSELFDSIFIHWGMSHSKGDYVGASTVFKKDNVDHIDNNGQDLYGRDQTRSTSAEHRGILYGEKVPEAIKEKGFRTTPEEYSKLYFNENPGPMSETSATKVNVTYSKRSFESTPWEYNEEDGKYHTKAFENDFARDNLLILYDNTEYITKENYEGPGSAGSVTYCNYKFAGGKGELYSQGTVKEIEWLREDGKLILKDPSIDVETANTANVEAFETAKKNKEETYTKPYIIIGEIAEEGEEAEATEEAGKEDADAVQPYVVQPINKGKTWIGWVSKNNGGKVAVS